MSKNKIRKIIYLNVVILFAFIASFILAIMVLTGEHTAIPVEIATITLCGSIVTPCLAFWTLELKWLFNIHKKGISYEKDNK